VINRGQDRQRIFHVPADYRFFLSLLVRAMRAGRIRIHAYCLMPNHFHLLLESRDGNLSATMHWLQFRYAAYFNRTRAHTGHVFGGRFRSFPVTSLLYLLLLIRYIDRNPWKAKKRVHPLRFPWCSAYHHVRPGPRPRWLDQRVVGRFLQRQLEQDVDRVLAYSRVFRIAELDPAGDQLVELRLAGQARGKDELDVLVHAKPRELASWLKRRASEVDARVPPLALVDAGSVLRALEMTTDSGVRLRTPRGRDRAPKPLVAIGLLRDLVGVTYEVASELLTAAPSRLRTRYALHRAAVLEDTAYLDLVARTVHAALTCAFGVELRSVAQEGAGLTLEA